MNDADVSHHPTGGCRNIAAESPRYRPANRLDRRRLVATAGSPELPKCAEPHAIRSHPRAFCLRIPNSRDSSGPKVSRLAKSCSRFSRVRALRFGGTTQHGDNENHAVFFRRMSTCNKEIRVASTPAAPSRGRVRCRFGMVLANNGVARRRGTRACGSFSPGRVGFNEGGSNLPSLGICTH
jgi:hypothetical protein